MKKIIPGYNEMKNNHEINGGRRAVLKSAFRFFILGGIVLFCGLLGKRQSGSTDEKSVCEVDLPCRECSKFSDCTISKAEKVKEGTGSKR